MIRCCGYEFTPGLSLVLSGFVVVSILTSLGLWQVDRAGQKEAIIEDFIARSDLPSVALASLHLDSSQTEFRAVHLDGEFITDTQLLLDNRTHLGRAGYQVLTLFRMANQEGTVLVNRGWVPLGHSRQDLPDVPASAETQRITGRIYHPKGDAILLSDEQEQAAAGLRVVQSVDVADFESILSVSLLPAIVLLDKDDANGFTREWKPVYGIGPDKHMAYALQWFSIAVIAFITFVALSSRKLDKE